MQASACCCTVEAGIAIGSFGCMFQPSSVAATLFVYGAQLRPQLLPLRCTQLLAAAAVAAEHGNYGHTLLLH